VWGICTYKDMEVFQAKQRISKFLLVYMYLVLNVIIKNRLILLLLKEKLIIILHSCIFSV